MVKIMPVDLRKIRGFLAFFVCCILLLCSISYFSSFVNADESNVYLPILMYHHISKDKIMLNEYTISPGEFENDLRYIKANGYTTVQVSDLIAYVEKHTPLPKKSIMITFDDGYESAYAYAYPLLKKYNMKAVVNVIGRVIDVSSKINYHVLNYSYMTWSELVEISSNGVFEIQNHSYDMHTKTKRQGIQKLNRESIEQYTCILSNDILSLQQRAKEMLGVTPTAFALPFGCYSKESLPILKELGFKAIFRCWEKVNKLTGDPEDLYHLYRFNRAHGINTQKFFKKIQKL